MSQPQFSNVIEIAASPERIWRVMADMERWPVWTPSVVRVKRLTPGLFGVGSRARFHQPTLPPAW